MISVIIPTYNRANVIKKSIDSILNQTYSDLEVIIVDDGSIDQTKEVIDSYQDNRIRYVRNDSKKHGPAVARNIGILESHGEYIAFNDSDDKWLEDKLEKQIYFMMANNADVTFCTMRKIVGKREVFIPDKKFSQKNCTLENILKGSFTGTPALFGKTKCFRECMFDEKMKCNEDWDLVIRLIEKYDVVYQKENLVEVTTTEKSVSSDCANAIVMMEYIRDKYKRFYKGNKKSLHLLNVAIRYQKVLNGGIDTGEQLKTSKNPLIVGKWIGYRLARYLYSFYLLAIK